MTDAVIVLANLMAPDGTLNQESKDRVEHACHLVRSGVAPVLVTSGWACFPDHIPPGHDHPIRLADAMAAHALACGLSADAVIAEPHSRDTVGDAVFPRLSLAQPRGWRTVHVVTSDYHVPRAAAIFAFVYGQPIPVDGVPSADAATRAAAEAASLDSFRGTFQGIAPGDLPAIVARLRHAHPYYNGTVHPTLA